MNKVIQHIRSIALLQAAGKRTDGQLLESFVRRREAAALEVLVRRHGTMVWGVCRRILHTHHDAEDAFQATFLVLVRKAATVKPREMVGNWLYGVARQTALKARATRAKRRTRERHVTDIPEPAVKELDLWHDLLPVLDQELSRLPDKYRVAIVLCDLEGKTRKEAARQLGCPEGTVAGRLTRARVMLAKRLTRMGVALSGGALAAVLSQQAASAGAPAAVVVSTIKAASLLAAGKAAATGAISVKVAALTEGVLKAMLFTKLKIAAAALLIVAVAVVGSGGLLYRTQAAEPGKQAAQPTTSRTETEVNTQGERKTKPDKNQEASKTLVEEAKADVAAAEARLNYTKDRLRRLNQIYETAKKPEAKDDAQTFLSDAIKALNTKASHDSIGQDETPITEPEVIAAIRAAKRPDDSAVTDKLFDAFKKIAETKQLPPGVELEAVGGGWDPGGSFVYDVWWVRLRMPKEANGTYGFVIRERIIRSRTLQEEVARLELLEPKPGELRPVDGGRTQERINDLKTRIEKMKTK